MECNRDEALRAKSIAETKFEQKDFVGAKKFVLKAQALFPGLEGLSQLSTVLDVYISAENKINGEVDWYGVLGVSPSADDETVRKQYRKLALILHPDKNKHLGADGAFKLLSEAWSLLSDKGNRLMYNQRRSSTRGGTQQKAPVHSSAPTRANGFHNNLSGNASVPPTSLRPPSKPRNDTFWTICRRCNMHYEYLKVYLNQTLLCPNCREAFMAKEMPPPHSVPRPQHPMNSVRTATHGKPPTGSHSSANGRAPHPGKAGFGESTDPSIAVKAANVVQLAHERMKREREGSQNAYDSVLKNETLSKKMRLGEESNRHASNPTHCFSGRHTRELTPHETNKILMVKAKKEILKKLSVWRSETVRKVAPGKEKEKVKEKKNGKEKSNNKNGKLNLSSVKEVDDLKSPASVDEHVDKEDPTAATMSVPDPDFHNFDLDRTETCFQENEVWAAYDDDDGMPRFYALIHKVLSVKPFKLKLSWLNSKTNTEFGPIKWVSSGFYKTCGEFKAGRAEQSKSLNAFSHKVKFSKEPHGAVHIFPQKGEVWALFRNWSPDWNEQTPDEVIHKYDMVIVLDDYDQANGVSVSPLVKVSGFKTVFHPHADLEKVKPIPKEEMFRFSHQVPSHVLTGEEGPNSPKGYVELDPAATPLELLQVITTDATDEVQTMQKKGDVTEDVN
ncbi:unnamed protein product [Cuscuta campestris]|uniref:J domain-containing protein n=2 Tax=Cuscuta sect. Cleistogrammica TaxID=1824901 RepID=A0A484L8P8_9ASTE|nr:hypothetical protein DM860_010960 [Cuscuta australis]VFQ72663.1 unnamed protein product [Cuscuta campestris]